MNRLSESLKSPTSKLQISPQKKLRLVKVSSKWLIAQSLRTLDMASLNKHSISLVFIISTTKLLMESMRILKSALEDWSKLRLSRLRRTVMTSSKKPSTKQKLTSTMKMNSSLNSSPWA